MMLAKIAILSIILTQSFHVSSPFIRNIQGGILKFGTAYKPAQNILVARADPSEKISDFSLSKNQLLVAKTPHEISNQDTENEHTPEILAKSAIVLDGLSDKILFEKNSNEQLPIASITKIMTVIVALESEPVFEDIVSISNNAISYGGSTMHLQEGEEITVLDLFYGMLLSSANDATIALVEYISHGDINQFVGLMNEKAISLGLMDTHFANPTGLDQEGNYSSAHDLAQLTDYAMGKEFFRKTLMMPEYTSHVLNREVVHHLKNTDKLLGVREDIIGGKTGFTYAAGLCFVGIAEREGHELIVVILNSDRRFEETGALIDWAFDHYTW